MRIVLIAALSHRCTWLKTKDWEQCRKAKAGRSTGEKIRNWEECEGINPLIQYCMYLRLVFPYLTLDLSSKTCCDSLFRCVFMRMSCKSGAADRSSELTTTGIKWLVHFPNPIIILKYPCVIYFFFSQAAGQNEKLCPEFSFLAVKGKALESNYHFMPSHNASKTENKMVLGLSAHYSAQEQREQHSACSLSQGKIPARLPFTVDTMCIHTTTLIRKEGLCWFSIVFNGWDVLPCEILHFKQNLHTRTCNNQMKLEYKLKSFAYFSQIHCSHSGDLKGLTHPSQNPVHRFSFETTWPGYLLASYAEKPPQIQNQNPISNFFSAKSHSWKLWIKYALFCLSFTYGITIQK